MGIIEQMATIALAAVTNFITRWLLSPIYPAEN